jgi:type IV pilus assembly protein PilO
MNLSEINWDINAAGAWPVPIKILTILIICVIVATGGVYYDTTQQLAELENFEKKEQELKQSFEIKQKKAVNLQDYRDQYEQIEASLGEMLRQMPTKAEVASLLIDISQTGLASGLEFQLFKPSGEIRQEFYSELPISIQVLGRFEELGLFVSGLASLPRIVTVHNVSIKPIEGTETMQMNAIIKTYSEGVESTNSNKKKKRRGQK